MAAAAVVALEALKEQVAAVTDHSRGLLKRVRTGELLAEKPQPILWLRGQLLLRYLQDLGLLLAEKAGGRSLQGSPTLPRLVETRVVLDKLRPLEQRLRPLLERLLRAGGRGPDDPLSFRPSPGNLDSSPVTTETPVVSGASSGGGRANRYVPPRLVPVQYGLDPEQQLARRRALARRQALTSSTIRELWEELGEAPREEQCGGGAAWGRGSAQLRQRIRLEESLLTRLPKGRGQCRAGGAGPDPPLAEITHFRDISALDPTNQEAPPLPKKRKKGKPTHRKRKGFGRRR